MHGGSSANPRHLPFHESTVHTDQRADRHDGQRQVEPAGPDHGKRPGQPLNRRRRQAPLSRRPVLECRDSSLGFASRLFFGSDDISADVATSLDVSGNLLAANDVHGLIRLSYYTYIHLQST